MNNTYTPERGRRKDNPAWLNAIDAKKIMTAVESHFNITTDDMIRKCRRTEILYPRQVAMYLLAHYSCLTLKSIGVIFSKDHTTVIHSMEVIDDYLSYDDLVKEQIATIVSTF
jgi:chromosomal replication initiator protein